MADEARRKTDKTLAEMEKHLSDIYSRAQNEIGQTWKKYMEDAAKKVKPLEEAYEAAKKSGDADAIKSAGKALAQKKKEVTLMDSHYKRLTEQVATELSHVNETAAAYVNDQLPKIYKTNYNFTAEQIELQTNNAISFELVNERTIKNLINAGDKSLLPPYKINPKKDIPWNMRNINGEILQGIIQGESMDKMAKRLEKVGVTNAGSSIRAARTIVTTVENQARYDSAKAAADKGVIMKKLWIATNDNRTRDAHRDAWADYGTDEKAILLEEPFIVGGEEMMKAGDIHASGANRYNCRCSTPYFAAGFTSILPPEKQGSIKVMFIE